jgi:hypothetical protein
MTLGGHRCCVGGAFYAIAEVVEATEREIVRGRRFGYLKVNIERRGSIWAWCSNLHLECAAGIQGVKARLHYRWWTRVIMCRGRFKDNL